MALELEEKGYDWLKAAEPAGNGAARRRRQKLDEMVTEIKLQVRENNSYHDGVSQPAGRSAGRRLDRGSNACAKARWSRFEELGFLPSKTKSGNTPTSRRSRRIDFKPATAAGCAIASVDDAALSTSFAPRLRTASSFLLTVSCAKDLSSLSDLACRSRRDGSFQRDCG